MRAFKEFKSNLRIEEQATSRSRGKQVHLIKEDLSTLGDEGYVSDVRVFSLVGNSPHMLPAFCSFNDSV